MDKARRRSTTSSVITCKTCLLVLIPVPVQTLQIGARQSGADMIPSAPPHPQATPTLAVAWAVGPMAPGQESEQRNRVDRAASHPSCGKQRMGSHRVAVK